MTDVDLFKRRVRRLIQEAADERAEKMREMFLSTESLLAEGTPLEVAIDAQWEAYPDVDFQKEFTEILHEASVSSHLE